MSDSQTGNRSALAAVVAAVASVLTVVANLAGIAQLQTAPTVIVVAVLALGALILGLQAIISRKTQGGLSVWLAIGAILCAIIALVVMIVSATKTDQSAATQAEASKSSQPNSTSQKSTPSGDQPGRPMVNAEVQLWLDYGSDVDQAELTATQAQAATGKTDVALKYYGNLHATGKGFYKVASSDNPEAACRTALAGGRASEKEVLGITGGEYCVRTSDGNIAWIRIVSSSTIALESSERSVTLAVKVWSK